MKRLGPAALAALALLAAGVVAAQTPAPEADASDGFARRATPLLEETRRRGCDARPDGPARRACVEAALAVVHPAGFAPRAGEDRKQP